MLETQMSQTITLFYLTLLVHLQLWSRIKKPKPKRDEAGSLSKYEIHKLQRLYTQSGAAYGSVLNFVKASILPVSKVRQCLLSKFSYIKFNLATRKFKKTKTFSKLKNEIWFMDLAYVDKLANDNKRLKYLLISSRPV